MNSNSCQQRKTHYQSNVVAGPAIDTTPAPALKITESGPGASLFTIKSILSNTQPPDVSITDRFTTHFTSSLPGTCSHVHTERAYPGESSQLGIFGLEGDGTPPSKRKKEEERPSSPQSSKVKHKEAEKGRRAEVSKLFDELKCVVSQIKGERFRSRETRATVLTNTIQLLRQQQRQIETLSSALSSAQFAVNEASRLLGVRVGGREPTSQARLQQRPPMYFPEFTPETSQPQSLSVSTQAPLPEDS